MRETTYVQKRRPGCVRSLNSYRCALAHCNDAIVMSHVGLRTGRVLTDASGALTVGECGSVPRAAGRRAPVAASS